MKRIFIILLTLVLLLGICPMSALAETGGSGNVDGGGGDMGQGTSQNSWNPGMDGVRITVVDAESGQPVSSSFDLTNKSPSIKVHFGKVSKIQYANGASISPTTGNYDYYTPATPMPRIISSGSQSASIEAIKKYFCSEYAVKLVAQQTGIAYEELIGGQYKLFLEPIAYFKHNGIMMAMTAHEAALYDNQAGGSLRKTMTSLTHKNLPLAMFLEYADMGFPAYTGATNKTCSNDTIITYLGMGIVWFTDPPEQPEPTDYDYNQLDERWADLPYGTDNIGGYGCGPTSMAIVVSSLTDQTVDPPTMAEWAYQNGYWCSGNGSYHSLIPGAAEGFGLQWESISTDDPQAVVDALASGKLIVALMSKGHFTSSGHFMVLRGVTSEGKILVADPASKKRSEQEWDISIILDEARKGAAAGGPLWAIY